MIVNDETLENFSACADAAREFAARFPDGLDIAGLWGTPEQANETWHRLLANEFLRTYIGWAIGVGLLPARIRADLRGADRDEWTRWPEGFTPTPDKQEQNDEQG